MQYGQALLYALSAVIFSGCAYAGVGAPGVVAPPISISPSEVGIGMSFTVTLLGVPREGNTDITPPDGTYSIQIEEVPIEVPGLGGWLSGVPIKFGISDSGIRADIGTIVVANGLGTGTFKLDANYGNVQIEVGKGIFVFARGDKWGSGANAVVAP